jgi:hypothetical protein
MIMVKYVLIGVKFGKMIKMTPTTEPPWINLGSYFGVSVTKEDIRSDINHAEASLNSFE